jgi:hypothetical protein
MNLYRVWCRFEPDHVAQITGRKGQWRVICSYEWKPLSGNHSDYNKEVKRNGSMPEIGILSTKQYRKGVIIRPHKELNRVLEARRHHDH